jgi:predicted enzyme related to lactoylglutathione lyase
MTSTTPPFATLSAVPIFAVDDVAATARWYEEILGWTTTFTWPGPDSGEAPWYAGVYDGDVGFHLNSSDPEAGRPGKAYLFVRGVDALAEAIQARGGKLSVEPKSYDYGMRDFSIHDPAGNQITFGESTRSS